MVESSMPLSATSRSDSRPVIQMSNFSAMSRVAPPRPAPTSMTVRSEEHTSELQSLMRISYAVFCLKKKTRKDADQERYVPSILASSSSEYILEYIHVDNSKHLSTKVIIK